MINALWTRFLTASRDFRISLKKETSLGSTGVGGGKLSHRVRLFSD